MSCKPSEFTAKGHFIVLSGLTEDGYVLVNDPNAAHGAYSYKSTVFLISLAAGKDGGHFRIFLDLVFRFHKMIENCKGARR